MRSLLRRKIENFSMMVQSRRDRKLLLLVCRWKFTLILTIIFQFLNSSPFLSLPASRKKINAGKREIIRIKPHQHHQHQPETTFNEINLNAGKKYPVKPYKMKNKFKSSKCKCEDNSKMWNCRQIQTQIGRCHSNQFLCCSNYNQFDI